MAHELRNSLSTVRAAFDAIRNARVGPTSRTSEVLNRHLRYLAEIVDDLVGQSRLHAGVPVAREPVVLGSFVEELVAATPKRNGVRVETAIDPELTVSADPYLLTSSVTNLLQNAVKFIRAGGSVVIRG